MDQRTSTQREPLITLAIWIVIISLFIVIIGTTPAYGFLWNVDHVDNISIGPSEDQTISGIKVYSENDPVKVHVGDLVAAGADFDKRNSSYNLGNGQTAGESEVYITNPETTDATIIVTAAALNNTSAFDIRINNINTTGITAYNQNLERVNEYFQYTTTQAGEPDQKEFSVRATADVSFASAAYNNETGKLNFETINFVDDPTNKIVIWRRSSDGDFVEKLATIQEAQNSISIKNESIEGRENIAVTVQPVWVDSPETIYAADQTIITAPIPAHISRGPVYYPQNKSFDEQYSGSIYFKFNTKIRSDRGQLNISYLNGSTSEIPITDKSNSIDIFGDELFVHSNVTGPGIEEYIENIGINGVKSIYRGEDISDVKYGATRVSSRIPNQTNVTVAQGESVMIVSSKQENIHLTSNKSSIDLNDSSDTNYNVIWNTSGVPAGEYILNSESATDGSEIKIKNTSLSPQVPIADRSAGIKLNFGKSPVDRSIAVTVRNSNDESVDERLFEIESNQYSNESIEVSESGRYSLEIEDLNSGASTIRSTRVLKNRNLSIDSDWKVNEEYIGNKNRLTVYSTYNNSRLLIVNKSDNQSLANASISTPDPGRTSISVNTYAFGNESLTGSAITAGSGATVESVETSLPNATLSPGTYRVAVRSEQGLAATSDEASVTVESRATNGMRVYSTADLDRDELGTARAVRRAIDEGTLSRTETVRSGETVAYAVNATGLTGLPAARNATVETGRDLARLDGLAFGVRSNASAVATATGDVESVPTNSTVHLDERGLFVVGRGSDVLATDETPTDGETFTAEFRVEDERLRAATSDSADDHDVSATVTFEGAESPEDDGDPSDGGDSTGGGGATGGSGGSGAGGGGGPGAGGGGGPSAGGPGQAVGSESAAASTEDAPTTGPAAEEARGRGEDPARLGFRRTGSRAEIRPAADVRGVASDESAVPPTGASVWTGPARARNDRSGSDADPSGDGSPSGATGTAASGNEEGSAAGAGEEGSAATNGGASAGDATGAPSTGGDATDAEPPTPSYDDAPIRATAEDVPGFGPPVTVVALLLAGGLGARRRGS